MIERRHCQQAASNDARRLMAVVVLLSPIARIRGRRSMSPATRCRACTWATSCRAREGKPSMQVERRATNKGMRASQNREDHGPASSTRSRSAQVDRTTEAGNDRNAFRRPRWARGQGASGETGVDGTSMRWSMGSVRIRKRLAGDFGWQLHRGRTARDGWRRSPQPSFIAGNSAPALVASRP